MHFTFNKIIKVFLEYFLNKIEEIYNIKMRKYLPQFFKLDVYTLTFFIFKECLYFNLDSLCHVSFYIFIPIPFYTTTLILNEMY